MDIEKTKEYYSNLKREDTCDCDYCQNYIDEIKLAYPDVSEYLSTLGVDIERPFEVLFPLDPVNGYMDYYGVEYLIAGDSGGFEETQIGDITICKTDAHPAAVYEGEYFVIIAGTFHIKCNDKYNFT